MDRLTFAYLAVPCCIVVFVLSVSSDVWFPLLERETHATWFPFLPPLVGSLVGVFAANLLEQRRTQREKARERDLLLTNIRAELEAIMAHTMDLQDPIKRLFIRRGDLATSEKVQTETWDSCVYSGQTALLGFEERRRIASVYRLLHDYNERNWENELEDRQDRMLDGIRERVQRLWNESFWPKGTGGRDSNPDVV